MLCFALFCTDEKNVFLVRKGKESGIREHGEMVSVKNYGIGMERLGSYFADQTFMVMVVVYFHHLLAKMIQMLMIIYHIG